MIRILEYRHSLFSFGVSRIVNRATLTKDLYFIQNIESQFALKRKLFLTTIHPKVKTTIRQKLS